MLPRCKAPWSWHISNIVVSTRSQEVQIQYCFIMMVKDGQSFLSFPLCLSISFPPARKHFPLILSTPTTLQLPESRFWICHSRDQPCLRDLLRMVALLWDILYWPLAFFCPSASTNDPVEGSPGVLPTRVLLQAPGPTPGAHLLHKSPLSLEQHPIDSDSSHQEMARAITHLQQ